MKFIKQLRRFLFWATIILVLILLFSVAWLHYLFPDELVKKEICKFVQKNYALNLTIHQLDVSLFSGITLTGFEFYPHQNGIDSLFAFKKLKLSYRLLPLLEKKLVINEISLLSPSAHLIHYADGKWNWQILLNKFKKTAKPAQQEKKSKPSAISFNLTKLSVNKLSVVLSDYKTGLFVRMQGLNFSVADFFFLDNKHYYGNIQLDFLKDSPLSIRRSDLYLETALSNFIFKIKADPLIIKTSADLDIRPVKINFRDKKPVSPGLISFKTTAAYLQISDSLIVSDLQFKLGDLAGFSGLIQGSKLKTADRIIQLGKGNFYSDIDKILDFALASGFVQKDKLPAAIQDGKFLVSDIYLTAVPSKQIYQLAAKLDCNIKNFSLQKKQFSLKIDETKIFGNYQVKLENKKLKLGELTTDINLNIINAKTGKTAIKADCLALVMDPVLKENFLPEQIQSKLNITNLNGCDISDSLTIILPQKLKMPELVNQTQIENRLSVLKFEPDKFIPNLPFNADIMLDHQFSLVSGRFKTKIVGDIKKPRISLKKTQHFLPDQSLEGVFYGDLNGFPDSLTIAIERINTGNFCEMKSPQLVYRLQKKQLSIHDFAINIWLEKLLSASGELPEFFKQNIELQEGLTSILINSDLDLIKKKQRTEVALRVILPNMVYNQDISLNGFDWQEKIYVNDLALQAEGVIKLNKADFKKKLSAFGLSKYLFEHKIGLDSSKILHIDKFSLAIQSLGKHLLTLKGSVNLKHIFQGLNLTLDNYLPLNTSYPFVKQINNLSGVLKNKIVITSDSAEVIKVRQNHYLKNVNLTANLDSTGKQIVKVKNLNLDLPVNLAYNLKEKRLMPWQNWSSLPIDLLTYRQKRSDYAKNGRPVKNLTIEDVVIDKAKLKTTIKNLESDLYFDNNRFFLNYFYLEFLGGNVDGQLGVILPDKMDSTLKNNIRTSVSVTASGINTANLNMSDNKANALVNKGSSELNFSANFRINGLDFVKNPDIDGTLNITRISDDDARSLLEFLNKGSADQTLDLLKNTLNLFPGIKLSLFSFTIKNNFIYTLIKLQKPWYLFYFPLADQISPSKQSLRFYLDKYVKEK